jgi:DNA-binding HxlR family transcriptional regulator
MPDTNSNAAVQRIESALHQLSPYWTVWVLQTAAQHPAPVRMTDVSNALPFVAEQNVAKRLGQLRDAGLLTQDRPRGPYQVSARGQSLTPVFDALSTWSHQHLVLGPTAGAERIEDAVQRLYLRHTTTVAQTLLDTGPQRLVALSRQTGVETTLLSQRLLRMQEDGLLTRSSNDWGAAYTLTPAGRDLAPVYDALDRWTTPFAPVRPAAVPVRAATRTHTGLPLRSGADRSAAALRRSPAASQPSRNVPAAVFSHAPQPPVPLRANPAPQPSRANR